jgi:hypothetical protein
MEQLSGALDELYGALYGAFNPEKGEAHASGFICSFIDDAYTPEESLCWSGLRLLGDMLLRPATQREVFAGLCGGRAG